MSVVEIKIDLTKKQSEAFSYLTDSQDRALLYGGAKGGGKSYFLCFWITYWTYYLIKFFDIKESRHPVPLGFFGRKRAVDFGDTTLETFKRIIPSQCYQIREQDKEIIFEGRAKIFYGGLDDEKTVNKFNSAEFAFMAIDQAEETLKKEVAVLQAALRLRVNNKTPPYKELYTANPAECWLKDDFLLDGRKNGIFVPALPDDNPYLPVNYKQTLRDSFSYDPVLLKAYLEGDWDAFSNIESAVFKPLWFEAAKTVDDESDDEIDPRIIAVDVATKHGENETVIVYRVRDTIKEISIYKGVPAPRLALLIKEKYEEKNANICVVDSDGYGQGISDILQSQGVNPCEFHGGTASKAMDDRRFRNLRAQFYTLFARKLEKQCICLKDIPKDIFTKMKSQSCAIMYKAPDPMARIQIESKEDMASRGIKSPDITDAVVYSEYGLWMSQYADIKEHKWR